MHMWTSVGVGKETQYGTLVSFDFDKTKGMVERLDCIINWRCV